MAETRKRGSRNPAARTSELMRRRRDRWRRRRLLLAGVLVAAVGLFAAYHFWLRDSSVVAVRDLTVRGLEEDSPDRQAILEAVKGAVGEMTTLHPRPDLLEQRLSRFPRVANSEVDTSFPKSAVVTVTLRRDGSLLGEGRGTSLIATDGWVLGPAGNRSDLPRIEGGRKAVQPGTRLEGDELSQALVVGGVPGPLRSYVRNSRVGDDGVEVTMSNATVLLFGPPTLIGRKWRAAAAVIADPETESGLYVDLMVPRRPTVRPVDSETEPSETEPEPETDPVAETADQAG